MQSEEDPSSPFGSRFFRTSYLYLFTFLAAVYVVVIWFVPTAVLAVPLGLFTLLIAPGYALGALTIGRRERWPWSLTFILVVGLSVAFTIAEGLVLLELHQGLPARVLALVSLALLCTALAFAPPEPAVEWLPRFGRFLQREFRLPGHSAMQRMTAYTLLVAIVVVLVVIVYLAAVFPGPTSSTTLGISGPNGTTASLPTSGTRLENLTVIVTVGNGPTGRLVDLTIRSLYSGSQPANYSAVPWTLPLPLGPNVTSSDSLTLTAGQSVTVDVVFRFATAGDYTIEFLLVSIPNTLLASTSLPVAIT